MKIFGAVALAVGVIPGGGAESTAPALDEACAAVMHGWDENEEQKLAKEVNQ